MEIPYTSKPRPDTGLYNAKLGIWLFLASEVMLFGALFSAYIMLRVGAPAGTWPEPGSMLKVIPGTVNTLVLICSSVTVVISWAALKFKNFALYKKVQGITILCALIFMGIKAYEYHDKFTHYEIIKHNGEVVDGHKVEMNDEFVVLHVHGHAGHDDHEAQAHEGQAHDGGHAEAEGGGADPTAVDAAHGEPHDSVHGGHDVKVMRSEIRKIENYGPWHSTYLAIYFTLTGLHALHVVGGAFVIFMIWGPLAGMWHTDPVRYTNRVEVSGLFWHFVDLVWIFLFPVLYLL